MCPLWHGLYLGWLGMCFCHTGLACTSSVFSPYFDRKEKDSCNFRAFQSGRWPHSWHRQRFLSGTDLVKVLLLMREFYIEMFCWCEDEKSEPALRQWNTDYVVVPATDSTIVLGLGLKALKFMVFFSSCCLFGAMFWSFVREGWHYRGGKRLGLHRIH